MSKLIMTRGLPGSGKSTWAAQVDAVVVNKDNIRAELALTGWEWSPQNESTVILRRDQLIIAALKRGEDVISSDCNFGQKHERALRGIADECGAEFEIKDFTHVPLAVCVERDGQREVGKVGEKVIRGMATANGIFDPVAVVGQYVPDPRKPKAFIVDLDGTLCLHNGRGPFEYDKCDTDLVNQPVLDVVCAMRTQGYQVIFCSGREGVAREKTLIFLEKYGLDKEPLYMRKDKDFRKDYVVKSELFNQFKDDYQVMFVVDDRPQVLRFWRSIGLFTFAVGDGKEF